MLLSELVEVSGTTAASIKFYRREGLLAAGATITATRQDYGQRHVERLQLIRVLREKAHAGVHDIRVLVDVIDDPQRPLVDALEIAQVLAHGLPLNPVATSGTPAREDPLVREVLAELGWPDRMTGPRLALDDLLRSLRAAGSPVRLDVLLRYARALDEIARADIDALGKPMGVGARRGGQPDAPPSQDVMVRRAVLGMVSYDRLTRILRALGHASYSILASAAEGGSGEVDA